MEQIRQWSRATHNAVHPQPLIRLVLGSIVSAMALVFWSSTARSDAALPTLNQADFDAAIRELSSNASFRTLTGASSLGSLFGFEIGVIGGVTSTPEIDRLSKSVSSSNEFPRAAHASLVGALSIPMGLTAEVMLLPKVNVAGLEYQQTGLGLKWSTGALLPVNLAVRGFYSQSELSFSQTAGGIVGTVKQENRQTGLQLLVSPMLPLIEPYAGLGFVSARGTMSLAGTGSLFNFTTSQSAESSPTTTQVLVGMNANLIGLKLGAEYARMFGTDNITVKLGFGF